MWEILLYFFKMYLFFEFWAFMFRRFCKTEEERQAEAQAGWGGFKMLLVVSAVMVVFYSLKKMFSQKAPQESFGMPAENAPLPMAGTGPKGIVMLLMLAVYIALAALFFVQENLAGKAAKQVSDQCVASVPKDVHTRLVAVTDIEGDDGSLVRALVDALKADSHFQVIERNQLDALLKEQALQISDIVSPEERIRPGMIRGVEGVIHGKVIERMNFFVMASFRVHLKMANVQSGEILLSKEVSSSVRSEYLLPAAGGLLSLLLAFFAYDASLKLWAHSVVKGQRKEFNVRQKVNTTLKSAIDNVRTTEHSLDMDRDRESVGALRTLRTELELVCDKMRGARFADIDIESPRGLRKKDARILDVCEDLLDAARAMAAAGGSAAVSRRVPDIRSHISRIEEMLTHRQ